MFRERSLDVDFARSQFFGLGPDWVLLDNAGGSQILQPVVSRIKTYYSRMNVQLGGTYAASQDAARAVAEGRLAASILFNAAKPEEIIFGSSTTVLLQNLSRAMQGQFLPGDEIVLTISDHESNIGPWESLSDCGVIVKFWPLSDKNELDLAALEALLTPRTKLVCVTHVSNIFGTINPVKEIAAIVHSHGAKICVDGVAYAPHRAVDVREWDVDYYVFSLYKAFGPHHAVMYAKYDLLKELSSLNHFFYGKDNIPGKMEPGNPNYELSSSVTGIVEYLCEIGLRLGAEGSARTRVEAAFQAIAAHESMLANRLLSFLNSRTDCRVVGISDSCPNLRVSTVSFVFEGRDSGEICRALDQHQVAVRYGDFHARRLGDALGLKRFNGAIRASMVHYNTIDEVDRLTAALEVVLDGRAAA